MKKKMLEQEKLVYKFASPTYMKFTPVNNYEDPQQIKREPFYNKVFNRVRSFLSSSRDKILPASLSKNNNTPLKKQPQLIKNSRKKQKISISAISKLKYVKSLTNFDILVGNEDQLDGIGISGVVQQFVDTEYYWSIRVNEAISSMLVDVKKNLILTVAGKELYIYKYHHKNIQQIPVVLFKIGLLQEAKLTQNFKDNVVICYETRFEIYNIVEQLALARVIYRKQYVLPLQTLEIFKITNPVENTVTLIFNDVSFEQGILSLWCMRVEIIESKPVVHKISKLFSFNLINENPKKVEIVNYAKDVYFINPGYKIYVIIKGYAVDVMEVKQDAQQQRQNRLKFLSSELLIHVTDIKAQIYSYKVHSHVHPPQVQLKSIDSIEIPELQGNLEFLDIVTLFDDNFAIFYQNSNKHFKLSNGEVKYSFLLTEKVKLDQKIKKLLPSQIQNMSLLNIQEKADMFKKMGFSTKDIYLKLWNNSSKSTVQDFKFLMDTKDYDTIKREIDKKLKKKSMNYRQVLLIEIGSLSMLSGDVFGASPVKENIKHYMISHFLLKKLEFYRQISMIQKKSGRPISLDTHGKLMINIQNYSYYQTIDVKSMLIELILRFCNEDKDETLKIRALVKHFKFPLRIIYKQVLVEIIQATKVKFLKLIKSIPELLPLEFVSSDDDIDTSMYEGIWNPITTEEWQKQIYHDSIKTLENKEILYQIYESVWFKSYWLTQHDFIELQKQQIEEIHNTNRGSYLFHITIEKIFEYVKDYPNQRLLIDHIQDNYDKFPSHLYGKIFLYQKLYEHFKSNINLKGLEAIKLGQFSNFLNWSDAEIFHTMFDYQKIKKGFILKDIKPLYARLSSNQTFLQGLLNFFDSDLSQISDIKYLLNRMNNEKKEFKSENVGIYEVIVRGMQLKFRIGGQNDIPLDDILIYLDNIAFQESNPLYKDINKIKQLNKMYSTFKQLKLNLSIFKILTQQQNILQQFIKKQIITNFLHKMQNYQEFKEISHKIYDYIKSIQFKIYEYREDNKDLMFIFLIKLLQYEEIIEFVKRMIGEDWIREVVKHDKYFSQNLVLYMYKWKVSILPEYTFNAQYLQKLVELLPSSNKVREYIQAEINLGLLLSSKQYSVAYPLNNGDQYFTTSELQDLINNLVMHILAGINISDLHHHMNKIQKLGSDSEKAQVETSLHNINQIIIIRLIQCGSLKEAINKIKVILQTNYNEDNIIYAFLLISKIQRELAEESKYLLLELSSYYSRAVMDILLIIQKLINLRSTTPEQITLLKNQVKKAKENGLNYDKNNSLLSKDYLAAISTKETNENFMNLIKKHVTSILKTTEQDAFITHFYAIYVFMCNSPWIIPKYIYVNRNIMNFKRLRYFFMLVSKEDIFNQAFLLQFFKRVFYYIYQSEKLVEKLQTVVENGKKMPLNEVINVEKIGKAAQSQYLLHKLIKCIEKMRLKLKIYNTQVEKKKKNFSQQQNRAKIKARLSGSLTQTPIQYFVIDSDNDKKPESILKPIKAQKLKNTSNEYNEFQSLYILMNRKDGGLQSYIGSQPKKQFRKMFMLSQETKNSIFQGLNLDNRNQLTNLMQNIGGMVPFDDGIRVNIQNIQNEIRIRSRSRSRTRTNGANEEEQSNSLNKKSRLQQFKSQTSNELVAFIPIVLAKADTVPDVHINIPQNPSEIKKKQIWVNPFIGIFKFIFENQENTIKQLKQEDKTQEKMEMKQYKIEESNQIQQKPKESIINNNFAKLEKHSSIKQIGEIQQTSKIRPQLISLQQIKEDQENIQNKKVIKLKNPEQTKKADKIIIVIQEQKQLVISEIIPIKTEIQQAKQSIKKDKAPQPTSPKILKITYEQPTIDLIYSILQNKTNITQNTPINLEILSKYQQNLNFQEFVTLLIRIMYENADISFNDKLCLTKIIINKYPTLSINKIFLDIYIKAETLQQKFHLFLPFDKILTIDGLFIEYNQIQKLFQFILPKIIEHLNEQQLFKACKVITLAFKKSELEHQVLFHYILKLIRINKDEDSESQEYLMIKQKMQGIFQKIPIKYLKKKQAQLMDHLTSKEKVKVAEIMIASFLKKYDQKTAEYFSEKYLSKN